MASREKAAAERLKDDEDVRRALKQAGASADESTEKPPVKRRHTLFVSTYILLLVLLGGVYYALRLGYFDYCVVRESLELLRPSWPLGGKPQGYGG